MHPLGTGFAIWGILTIVSFLLSMALHFYLADDTNEVIATIPVYMLFSSTLSLMVWSFVLIDASLPLLHA